MIPYIFVFLLLFFTSATAHSQILFKDISQEANVTQLSPTAGSSWGDVNNDGWPDIWVSNHHGISPTILINQKNGTFVNGSNDVLSEEFPVDFHGVAWADFDNDGDQDLIAVTGGASGRGSSPNYLFINENGKLIDKAEEFGVNYPLGRGRTPLWLDANQDGKLDLLLMNRFRENHSSALFLQDSNKFINKTEAFNFFQGARSIKEKINEGFTQLLNFRFPTASNELKVSNVFAQIADFTDSNKMDLIAYMQPSRLYALESNGFNEITSTFNFPEITSIEDAALGDFDGDGKIDMFITRARTWTWNVIQNDKHSIRGRMGKKNKFSAVNFRTDGEVTFEIHRPWMDPTDITKDIYPKLYIGSKHEELKNVTYKISTDDPYVKEPAPKLEKTETGVSIEYDQKTNVWSLKNVGQSIGFIITSTNTIESFEVQGFKLRSGELADVLLLKKDNKFKPKKLKFADKKTSCSSVTAGDFDNDMDLDLYLVCAGSVENYPNILYENYGKGDFRKVKHAGGAEGSQRGLGNQVAMADYDLDGFLDLFVTNGVGAPPFPTEGPYQLFRNMGNENQWLQIDLEGVESNRQGIGAKLVLEVNGKSQIRQADGGMHSFSQNYARIHFGLGPNKKADLLTIYWPSGIVQRLENVNSNQVLLVKELVQ